MVLESGTFTASISGRDTTVQYKIKDTYEAHATFKFMGAEYKFEMRKWAKTGSGVTNAKSTFNKFAQLTVEKFGDDTTMFGTMTMDDAAEGVKINYDFTPEQALNVIKYGIRQVFVCAEEIIMSHRRHILDYAIFWRERMGNVAPKTYEQYIHLMACHCLVHSNFLGPDAKFEPVDYAGSEQKFKGDEYLRSMRVKDQADQD